MHRNYPKENLSQPAISDQAFFTFDCCRHLGMSAHLQPWVRFNLNHTEPACKQTPVQTESGV